MQVTNLAPKIFRAHSHRGQKSQVVNRALVDRNIVSPAHENERMRMTE